MISTQIAKSGLFRFTVCPFPAFITILANAEIVSSRWMLLLFLDLYITLNCNSIKSNLLVLTLYRAKILTMHFDFDPVQEIVWSRVTKFVTVENVTDWEAKISRRQSNLRIHLQLFWSIMHIYREVKLKIGGMTNWTPTNISCILSVMLKNTTHCLDQGLTQAIPFNLHATD